MTGAPTSKRAATKAGGIITRPNSDARRKAASIEWGTPERVLARVRVYCGGPIPLDAATWPANPTGAVHILTPGPAGTCGLTTLWASLWDGLGQATHVHAAPLSHLPRVAWCNPPYSEFAVAFYRKITQEAQGDPARGLAPLAVLALLPVNRTETSYGQELMAAARAVCWVRGRLAFVRPTGEALAGNPFASVIFGLGPVDVALFARAFAPLGLVQELRPRRHGAARRGE